MPLSGEGRGRKTGGGECECEEGRREGGRGNKHVLSLLTRLLLLRSFLAERGLEGQVQEVVLGSPVWSPSIGGLSSGRNHTRVSHRVRLSMYDIPPLQCMATGVPPFYSPFGSFREEALRIKRTLRSSLLVWTEAKSLLELSGQRISAHACRYIYVYIHLYVYLCPFVSMYVSVGLFR